MDTTANRIRMTVKPYYTSLKPCTDFFFFFKTKAFIIVQSGDEAASKSDVTGAGAADVTAAFLKSQPSHTFTEKHVLVN